MRGEVPSFYRWREGVYSLEYSLDPLTWKVQTIFTFEFAAFTTRTVLGEAVGTDT
jgi:hypothetical protein